MNKMSSISRMLIAIGSLVMIVMYFVPVWSIYLIAPQYPEGLSMQIWLNKITGQVEIINGLNHYIGMKHIEAEMFPEFTFLVYILAAFILFGLVIAVTGHRRLLFVYLMFSLVGGVAALVDFYMWGYDYGHDLDPTAAIQVPGPSYQPPVIGHKKLLNFDSYSYPDTGGWIIVVVTGLFFLIWFLEWRRNRKQKPMTHTRQTAFAAMTMMIFFLAGCTPKPEKILFGKDNCAECKMTIMDPKFSAEIITKKGKVYKFDDVHCVAAFLERRDVELINIHQTLFTDYNNSNEFVQVTSAEFVVSSQLKSPMGGNAAAFKNRAAAEEKAAGLEGSKITNWATLYNILVK
ncbi:nitrous oxide reductase accessory protein NosL [Longitalea luteola]|uniref:nitrous oxide reductase accessory protein NosL n=1 Tax=Longitalea luteola TaxID=2812563 RepID=UPI001A975C43|nr:nitrous oxide reductase accessory protein NosL [Longitalea luteola]